ncbi:MAG: NADH-quinone oxidoreductase subunit J [Candidatus Bathyarchaeota archaeon]|nr:NADH-quinone oxidoreductase subunit J [Candidatus Bathyarchaeota archaeon]
MIEIIELILLVITCIFAILTVEAKDLLYAIISFASMSVTIGALFWILSAPYVAVFQILIYAGAIIVLFVAAIMLTSRRER